jgi:hypothetical protein
MLLVPGLYSVDHGMINEYGSVGGTRTGRETEVLGENPSQYHIVHHKSYMT